MKKIKDKSDHPKCKECGGKLKGRMGKKFCSESCKSTFHYKNNKEKEGSTYVRIVAVLKQNRRILKKYFLSGQSQIKKETLLKEGFDFNHLTHTWEAKNGNVFLFCFEFGFRDLLEKNKYELIMWQDYME